MDRIKWRLFQVFHWTCGEQSEILIRKHATSSTGL